MRADILGKIGRAGGNGSNGGLSSIYSEVVIVEFLGKALVTGEAADVPNAVKIVQGPGARDNIIARPVRRFIHGKEAKDEASLCEGMFGGQYIVPTSPNEDYRLRFGRKPIPLHDRNETWEEYDRLST